MHRKRLLIAPQATPLLANDLRQFGSTPAFCILDLNGLKLLMLTL